MAQSPKMNSLPNLIFLDLEASSLGPDSYPIEIAWSGSDGQSDSFLIEPVSNWSDWDSFAELTVHRVSKAELSARGISVEQAVHRLNQSLRGQVVLVDSLNWDGFWLQRLFDAAEINSQFDLQDMWGYLGRWIKTHSARPKHRALADAETNRDQFLMALAPFLDRQKQKSPAQAGLFRGSGD